MKYLLSGVSIWVLVDYTTAFNPDTARWIQHMPDIWLFYLGYPCARARQSHSIRLTSFFC